MLPCQLHRDCISCDEHFCLKGETRLELYVNAQIEETESLLEAATVGSNDGVVGAGRWLEHQRLALARFKGIQAVLQAEVVPPGAVISPSGVKSASKIEQACQQASSRLAVSGGAAGGR
jgi:hypothetical protein